MHIGTQHIIHIGEIFANALRLTFIKSRFVCLTFQKPVGIGIVTNACPPPVTFRFGKIVTRCKPVELTKCIADDYEARANLMWASSWALNNFLYEGFFQA
ncbi:MAG: hypothetical protein IIT61_08200, partial [Bacteroidales bacterium]|nr:hypothetical protein [Bacteroidales bacterium]